VAYITRGNRLPVFRHVDHAEAGIQVPGGSIEDGESPKEAVLREAHEETGLEGLQVRAFLGRHDLDLARYGKPRCGEAGIVRMFYYHLAFEGDTPERWIHSEMDPSDGTPNPDGIRAPIPFELYWVRFPDEVPELIGEQGFYLHKLTV
jgi:8-oxo-dGTP diphosphatase